MTGGYDIGAMSLAVFAEFCRMRGLVVPDDRLAGLQINVRAILQQAATLDALTSATAEPVALFHAKRLDEN